MMQPQPKPVKVSQDEKRLDFVRKMPCLIAEYGAANIGEHCAFRPCTSNYIAGDGIPGRWILKAPSEAHHVRKGTHTGIGRKPPASRTVPLCSAGHSEYHRIGHAAFEAKYGLNLEEHIERINREFRATQPTKPKVTRKPYSSVSQISIQCECGLLHKFAPAKLVIAGQSVSYFCQRLKSYVNARFRRTA